MYKEIKGKRRAVKTEGRKPEESGRSGIIFCLKITARIKPSVKHLLTGAGLLGRVGGKRFE